jgi:hypothetical protein
MIWYRHCESCAKKPEALMSNTLAIRELVRTFRQPLDRVGSFDSTSLHERATIVVCVVDDAPALALLPASLAINLQRLLELTGAREIRLAQDDEWGQQGLIEPVFADVRLAAGPVMVFSTDTSSETVAIRWSDFARRARPVVGDFAEPPRDRVGVHRLSYRE